MGMDTGGDGGQTALSEINVTPLVDVMLVLLVIFMVTTPLIEQNKEKRKVDMNLPVTRNNANKVNPEDTDKVILEIDEQMRARVGETLIVDCSDKKEGEGPMRFEPCFDTIEEKLGNNPKLKEQGTLYLLADTEIPYGFVVGTMARIKKSGINHVGMVTNPEYLEQQGGQEEKGE